MFYMTNCPDCGKNLALVGKAHICKPIMRREAAKYEHDLRDAIGGQKYRPGRPKKSEDGFDRKSYMRDYMRRKRAKK